MNRIYIAVALMFIVRSWCVGQTPSRPCDDSRIRYANVESLALKKVEPEYPSEPGLHVEGKVAVRVVIDKKGNVVSAKAICGHPLIMAPAVKAAIQWQFQPKRVNSKATKNIGVIVFIFKDVNRDRRD